MVGKEWLAETPKVIRQQAVFGVVKNFKAALTIEDSECEMQVRILSRLNVIRQELMERTWHPTRVCEWCGLVW